MARATLYQASYQDTLTHAAEAGGADLVVTSPPYCDARTYNNEVSWTLEDYAKLGDAVFAALKPGGHCLFNVDAPVREWRPGVGSERGFHPWKIMIDWAERVGFRVVDRLAFIRLGNPGAYAGRFRNDWEPLFWFQRPGGDGFFDKRPLATPSKMTGSRIAKSRKADGSFFTRKASGWAVENQLRHRGTAWDYGAVGNGLSGARDIEEQGHPARFPFDLASDIVQCFSPPDGLVCDPFLGGGTSLIAALHHDRNFIGGDLYARRDGKLWVTLAAEVAYERYGGGDLSMFGLKDKHELSVVTQNGERMVMG